MNWSIKSFLARNASLSNKKGGKPQVTISANRRVNTGRNRADIRESFCETYSSVSISDPSVNAVDGTKVTKSQNTEKRLKFTDINNNTDFEYQSNTPQIEEAPSSSNIPNKAMKSILKPSKRNNTMKQIPDNVISVVNKEVWQAVGYEWKENPTLRERAFMQIMWETIRDDWERVTKDEIKDCTPVDFSRVYDLETFEIVEQTPSVVDLTIYDLDRDEFGLFYDQHLMVDPYPPEGSPIKFARDSVSIGIKVYRYPVLHNVQGYAQILDSYELAPVMWKSQQKFEGPFQEDVDGISLYKKLQQEQVKKFYEKGKKKTRYLEEDKNGTWRLIFTEEVEPKRKEPMTSDEIQKYFGLNDQGGIILNMDHIQVTQGQCGLNRGKASRRFSAVPVGQDALKSSYFKQIKMRLSKMCLDSNFLRYVQSVFGHPRNKTSSGGGPGESVGSYALSLADDPTSTFSRNIENFITCTKDSREMSPQIMMRNMRQFMSGMKNYLVKHGEADFHQEVQRACSRLKPDEFLNLDTILEGVMHKLVVLPLRQHLYGLFVDYYTKSADIQVLVDNVKFALGKTPVDIGIRKEVIPPTDQSMRNIALIIQRLQEAELPLEKLELLMAAVSTIFETTGCPKGQALNADDFLPLLVYVVAKTGFVGAEIEAEFMWGLLQPSLLSGEAGYYLTALCSAVHVLKTFKDSQTEGSGTIDWRSSSMPTCSSVLRVIIPDEYNGSLQTRTLPVRPHTTTKEVCRIIAHKARITNPQDYGLFQLVDGEETLLTDVECPQDARLKARGKHCLLAYKRIEAKIAWPSSASFH